MPFRYFKDQSFMHNKLSTSLRSFGEICGNLVNSLFHKPGFRSKVASGKPSISGKKCVRMRCHVVLLNCPTGTGKTTADSPENGGIGILEIHQIAGETALGWMSRDGRNPGWINGNQINGTSKHHPNVQTNPSDQMAPHFRYQVSTLGPQNHEKWRFYTPKIWVITPKNEGFGFPWYSLFLPDLRMMPCFGIGSCSSHRGPPKRFCLNDDWVMVRVHPGKWT